MRTETFRAGVDPTREALASMRPFSNENGNKVNARGMPAAAGTASMRPFSNENGNPAFRTRAKKQPRRLQ